MRRISSYLILILFLAVLLSGAGTKVQACTTSLTPPQYIVHDAEAVVRATAREFVENQEVKFEITEILKGKNLPSTLIIKGSLNEKDGFNKSPVPYWNTGRSTGGLCHNYEYKKGGEYLLLLKNVNGSLTPYWRSLAPINEQLHSADDEWLKWVKEHLNWLDNATQLQKVELTFEMFRKYGFDTDGELLWKYHFFSSNEEKLRQLASRLESMGYSFVKISKPDSKEDSEESELQVEKIERRSPAMLILINKNIKDLSDSFDAKKFWFNVGRAR